ncbi:hypothetical protein LOK74_00720 [Brevibacillus humidisoli]|uniref:hypothetical protein n=1 Tax=Brevibacillus humidisoli TaxID=2895522 RepID=UPI001E2C0C65|nr:hypothetical protein [Brevibacillus humidisoli]UFJ41119.1 hypothetical protein LOK74_00720 [Brevibacillus humidisoli]
MKPYYSSANLRRIPELVSLSPQAAAAYQHFEQQVYQTADAIPQKTSRNCSRSQ